MGTKVSVGIDADFFGFLEKPGKVIPELGFVANGFCDHVAHFVDGDKGDNVFLDQGFVAVLPLSETEMHFFPLVDAVGCVLGLRGGFLEAVGIRLKVSRELLHLGLVWIR